MTPAPLDESTTSPVERTVTVDDAVIEACRRGDREALRRIFLACKDMVYSTALHFLGGDYAMAADITQDVFLKLAGRIGQFRGESKFTTWLQRITVNACLDERRRRRRFVSIEDEPLAESAADPAPASRPELARAVARAMTHLNPDVRLTLLLKHVEDFSYDQIAEAMGVTRGTVASRLNRGHAALARRLGPLKASGGDHA
jgi:RNA polymerase sigma-70 factor (ECF subfamily)